MTDIRSRALWVVHFCHIVIKGDFKIHDPTRWNSMGFRRWSCLCLPWSFHLISMSQAQVHTWPNFGEISSNIYEDIVFTLFFWVTACCDFDHWPKKLISTSLNPNTSVTKIGLNSLDRFLTYGVHQVFGMHRLTQALTHSLTHEQTDQITECLQHRFYSTSSYASAVWKS